jgi:hypothetical protein
MESKDGDMIGSQDELLFAYKDLILKKQYVLNLSAEVIPVKQRVVSNDDEDQQHPMSNPNSTRKTGRWEFSEVVLYQDGVKLFGERSWSKIAKHVGTRDRFQVKEFSETHRAKSDASAYERAIRSIGVAVDGVREIQKQLQSSEKEH